MENKHLPRIQFIAERLQETCNTFVDRFGHEYSDDDHAAQNFLMNAFNCYGEVIASSWGANALEELAVKLVAKVKIKSMNEDDKDGEG